MTQSNDFFDKLLYRRQFILGPRPLSLEGKWNVTPIKHSYHIHTQHDLPMVIASNANISLFLLGIAIDPFHPENNEQNILDGFLTSTLTFDQLVSFTHSIVGRWVLIYQNNDETIIINDPCALRQVHYINGNKEQWCASQPELLKQVSSLNLRAEPDLIEFICNKAYISQEGAWLGKSTIYYNCYRLMANHSLNLKTTEQSRYYPIKKLLLKDISEIIPLAANILKGTMTALAFRGKNTLALTAGWDSRLLLAATKDVKDKFTFYVNDMGILSSDHEDIWVPTKLSQLLQLDFSVKSMRSEIPEWFVNLNSRNVTGSRNLPKNKMIFSKFIESAPGININGNGSEICRHFYKLVGEQKLDNLTVGDLIKKFGYKQTPELMTLELQTWFDGVRDLDLKGFTLLDLLYWEQRMGIWGAQFPSEQDIAIDEFTPFNCRLLLETLNSSAAEHRVPPNFPLYKAIIDYLWADVLVVPINPKAKFNFTKKIKKILKAIYKRQRSS